MLGYGLAPCCCKPKKECLIFSDTFDRTNSTDLGTAWQEVSGNTSISSNELLGTGTYVVATTMNGPSEKMSVQVDVKNPTSSGAGTDRARVIVNYLDSNNYLYVSFENTGTLGALKTELKFYRRSGGTDTQLGITRTINTTAHMTNIGAQVCYDGAVLKTMGYAEPAAKIDGGFKAGLGYTGSLLSCRFDNFRWYRWSPEDNCPVCGNIQTNCVQCENQIKPLCTWIVNFGVGGWTNNTCSPTCTAISGEYVLTCVEASGPGACFESTITACRWKYTSGACGDAFFGGRNLCMQGGLNVPFSGSTNYRFSVDGIIRRPGMFSPGGPIAGEQSNFRYQLDNPISSFCNASPLTLNKVSENHLPSGIGFGAPCAGTLPATITLRQI